MGWFAPKYPIPIWEKAWTEYRMRWLAHSFDIERLLNAPIIIPNDEWFPDKFEPNEDSVQQLMLRICHWMNVDSTRLKLEILPDTSMPGAAGQYIEGETTTIRIAETQLDDLERLVATLAHELAHVLLLGQRRLDVNTYDHEWVTDLLPLYLGLGIFAANSTVREQGKQGYLPSRMFGYAFALFAFVRGENDFSWSEYLRPDALVPLRDGLQFLAKSTDTLFHPDSIRETGTKPIGALIDQLRTGSPTFRLGAIWQLAGRGSDATPAIPDLINAIKDKETAIGTEAIATLRAIGPDAGSSIASLVGVMANPKSQLRSEAAFALESIRGDPATVIPAAMTLLDDPVHILSGLSLVRSYGTEAMIAWPQLVDCFELLVVKGLEEEAESAADTLLALDPNGYENVYQHFRDGDPLVRKDAMRIFRRMEKVVP